MTDLPSSPPPRRDRLTFTLRWVVGVVLALIVLAGAAYGSLYLTSPAPIRRPASAHYHLRLQVIVAGRPVNFADQAYQTPFNKDICTAALTQEPIHFHDQKDQFVHIHWQGITGGLLLKQYGWNFIGGAPGILGYRFDQWPRVIPIKIHGRALPAPPLGARYYLYTGDQTSYQERNWNVFLHQNLQAFFGDPARPTSWLDQLVPAALAHGDGDVHDQAAGQASEEQLLRINHVIGNAVIFVQTSRPTPAQIKDRFAHLTDLPESSCGG